MRHRSTRSISFLILFAAAAAAQNSRVVRLHDDWLLQSTSMVKEPGTTVSSREFQAVGWYRASVPTTVMAALVDNKVYPDPYFGLNMKSVPGFKEGRWLVMPAGSPFRSPWWFRREFTLPAEFREKHLTLHLDGINYEADIWLNGRLIADHKTCVGAFRRFEFPVDEKLNPGGPNVLAIEIIGPGQGPDKVYPTKQIEATTGWDDHNPQPPDLNMGIWRDVYLAATGPASLHDPYIRSKVEVPALSSAAVTVSVEVRNEEDRALTGELAGEIESIRFSQPMTLQPREKRVVTFSPDRFPQLQIARPRVWWPVGLGNPELYSATLTFRSGGAVSDAQSLHFGIREATTRLNEEGWREYWINGRRVLIRGGAWMTSDMMLRLTPRRYEALVRYAKEANLNMLRSEGFSIRETDEFYDLCDRYGIMVTQQIFGRSIPDEPLAVACVKDMMLRIRNHPSLVHFLGHDETFPTESLDKAYRELIAAFVPDRTYQPHSGAFNVQDRFKTGGTRTGTRELWTYTTPAHYYLKKDDGAWGFAQSGGIGGVISPYESMRRMMRKEDLWPPFTDAWSFHTVIQGAVYFDAMVKALDARYGKPSGIEEFCLKGQAMNYESARGMYEAYGRNKYSATGITAWKYDAAWPASPTWQYIDWYLMAGGAYYGAKKACEPLHVQYSYDNRSVWVVNSRSSAYKGLKVSARVIDLNAQERLQKSAIVDVGPDGKISALDLAWPDDVTKAFFVLLELRDASGKLLSENRYWLSTVPDLPGKPREMRGERFLPEWKSLADFTSLQQLKPVNVRARGRFEKQGSETVGRIELSNPDNAIAFLVHARVGKGNGGDEITPAYWDDNYVLLMPRETKQLTVRFATADLGGQRPVLEAGWWNRPAGSNSTAAAH
jgi:exo-1,4-beta-D-glucosaminidase